jgi:hypothetical protein
MVNFGKTKRLLKLKESQCYNMGFYATNNVLSMCARGATFQDVVVGGTRWSN